MAVATKTKPDLAAIRADEVYTLATFERLTGLGGWARRVAQRKGLRVLRVGNRRFVRGADWHAYLERMVEATAGV